MIKGAQRQTFSQMYDGKSIFRIPKYQREYKWEAKQCEELLSDIMENEENYFIGSTIFIESKNQKCKEVIDGQQRLTTINLLLIAIYNIINGTPTTRKSEDEIVKDESNKIKDIILVGKNNRLELQEQANNNKDYKYLIDESFMLSKTAVPKESNFGNRRISRNYNVFMKDLLGRSLSIRELKELREKIFSLTFVLIAVEDSQSAYMIFEAMNNRGLALSPLDMIKNKYIQRKGKIEKWEELIENLGDEYSNQEQFLRNNFNAFRDEYIKKESKKKKVKATKSNLIKLYDDIIKNENEFNEILDRSKNYSLMIGSATYKSTENERIYNILSNFRRAEATSFYTIVLYLLTKQKEFKLSVEKVYELLDYILRYAICRNITNMPSTGTIPNILIDAIEKINDLKKKDFDNIFNSIKESINLSRYGKDHLKATLSNSIYDSKSVLARYLLCALCEQKEKNSKETKIDLWSVDEKGNYIWTIEHIFPEGANIPDCWVKMIGDGDKKLAKAYQDEYVHKLGNLTMTGYNSNLGNKSFNDKMEREKDGKKIGYKNGLSINNYIVKQNKWTKENIEERTAILVDDIIKKVLKIN